MLLEQFNEEAQLNRSLRQLYQSYGYCQYRFSKFEEYDFYMQNKRFLMSEHILTFSDPNGKLMALKPDITLSIAKNAKCGAPTEKVFYTETVYRVPKHTYGFREITQTGLECIGKADVFSMAEVLQLAAESLRRISERYVLELSDLGILSGILTDCGAEEAAQQQILAAFGGKNAHALRAVCRKYRLPEETEAQLSALLQLSGPLSSTLERVREMRLPVGCSGAIASLGQISSLLEGAGVQSVHLDFSVVNDMDYYNGLIFRGFVEGVPESVLSGGRYDNLLGKLGKNGEAIGFAIYLDALERFYQKASDFDVDTLVLYDESTAPLQVETVTAGIRGAGQSVRAQFGEKPALRCRRCLDLRGGKPE